MMKVEYKTRVYWVVLEVQIHHKYVGKTKQNRWKTKRRARKPEEHEQTPATTAVGTTMVWPWQPPRSNRGGSWSVWPVVSLNAAFWLLGASPWAAGFSFPWGILGLFASFF